MARLSELLSQERQGREDFKKHVPMERLTDASRPERVARARGWLLQAAELMPGGWVKDIPPLPAPDDQGSG